MKRILLSIAFGLGAWSATRAQLNEGGIPLSYQSAAAAAQNVPVSVYALPDWNQVTEKENNGKSLPGPYMVALFTASDVSFPASGIMSRTESGHQVWRSQIRVNDAKALGLYYDRFSLPQGVKLYIYNANHNHILGAYTSANNAPSGKFANEAIQGSVANIELNIAPGVNLDDIKLHIYRTAVYFRGIEYLNYYAADHLQEIDFIDSALSGSSSICMINAVCPLGDGYVTQRNATLQELFPTDEGVGACSATMMNTTGNAPGSCKQYFLSATHCDGANSTSSAHFDEAIMRFNFMQATCEGTAIPVSNTLVGANFVARADYTAATPDEIKGDFLLLELRNAIPASWGINLAGWNNSPSIPTSTVAPKKFIGFHHPDADMKKVSASAAISSEALGAPGSHWMTLLDNGLVSTGSSGSALFDGDGRVIGIASVAGPFGLDESCKVNAAGDPADGTANFVMYSKMSYDWDYSVDGSAANRKLKPWLDPANTGTITLNAVKSDCSALDGGTGITVADKSLDNAVSIYPNPVTGNNATIRFNLAEAADITVELFDITGKRLQHHTLQNVRTGNYGIDLSGFAAGMYLVKFQSGNAQAAKKIMLQ